MPAQNAPQHGRVAGRVSFAIATPEVASEAYADPGAFERSRRLDVLSFTHHAEVAEPEIARIASAGMKMPRALGETRGWQFW